MNGKGAAIPTPDCSQFRITTVLSAARRVFRSEASTPDSPHFSTAAMLARLTGLNRTDSVWTHHFVVLVLYDVAVPDELARCVEL